MIRKCYAKINLSLDILSKREDGYHNIDTIMTRIGLFDILEIKKTNDDEFTYESNVDLGDIEDNLIYKAYKEVKKIAKDKATGIYIKLSKNIPLAAGLAGGSTDCAETIRGLNELWNLKLSNQDMMAIGEKLGADIPFFFLEKSARARGIGEVLTTFVNKAGIKILLINDGTSISSAHVYKKTKLFGHIDTGKIVAGLEAGDFSVVDHFENVMEDVVLRDFPHLVCIKERLVKHGAVKALVSGSGASIFGIFKDDFSLDRAYEKFKDSYEFVRKVDLIDD